MDTRKLEILKTDKCAMLSLAEQGQGGSVIARLEGENIEAMREVRRRYNAHTELLAALEACMEMMEWDDSDGPEAAAYDRASAAIAKATGQA